MTTRVMQVLECGGPGGTGHQVAALCNGLDRERFHVTLVYAVRPGCAPERYEAMARGAARRIHVPEMVREISPAADLAAWWRLYRLFRAERPDIVHAHSSKAGFLARSAAWAAGVRRVYYSPRGYAFLQTDRSPLSRRLYRLAERSVGWIGEVVAVSESEGDLARSAAGARRVRVLPDAYLGEVPEAGPRLERASGRETLVCASGRLCHPRHPEAFVRLARRAASVRADIRFEWIGDGELRPQVDKMARDQGLGERFSVTGWLPQPEAVERLRGADLFVHYSRWEGLPNAVLEAMALGLPVIVSDIPGNRELVRPGENGYRVASEEKLFERTLELVEDPERRAGMGAAGQDIVRRKYGLERLLRDISDLYESTAL
ncbi:MAG: glycosyltransferase [Elusimicrobiota bacterium]